MSNNRYSCPLSFGRVFHGCVTMFECSAVVAHPNRWAYIQAFRLLCMLLYLKPTPQVFLQMYSTRRGSRVGWLSLISQLRSWLLAPFTSSYKKFKGSFFKVVVMEEGRHLFYDGDFPRFSFYWTRESARFRSWLRSSLSREDLETFSILDKVPYKIPTRQLLRVFMSPIRLDNVEGMLSLLSLLLALV